MTCPVCICTFTEVIRKPVECSMCHYKSCVQCCKTYLLGSLEDAQCMSCHTQWSYDFMISNFTKTFVNGDYKKHRESVLLEREKSLLVATMPFVEREKERRKLSNTLKEMEKEMKRQRDIMRSIEARIAAKKDEIYDLMYNDKPAERCEFVRACPATGCKGFLSTRWKCGVCDIKVCSQCHEIKGNDIEHVCDPQMVETAKAILKETRPCPNCAARIFKIDGCDQMWCTQCHIAFSWKKGTIEQGAVHNPHYFEYIRMNGVQMLRAPGDVPCGGIVDPRIFITHLRKLQDNANASRGHHDIVDLLRGMHFIANNTMFDDRFRVDNVRDQNRDLRIEYLMGELDEDNLKRKLQAREKQRLKKIDMRQILETLLAIMVDTFQRAVAAVNIAEVDEIFVEAKNVVRYINKCFVQHAQRFSSTVIYTIDKSTFHLKTQSITHHAAN